MTTNSFPGKPESLVTFEEFCKRFSDRDIRDHKRAFYRYAVTLMQAHSGTAEQFVVSTFKIGYCWFYKLISTGALTAVRVDAIKQSLNVDLSIFMNATYPLLPKRDTA